MKISAIDLQARLGDDGEHYDGLGREWLIQSGLIASSGEGADRSGQNGLLHPVEVSRPAGEGEAEARAAAAGSCSRECASCRCGGAEGEGE